MIRLAQKEDIPALSELLEHFHAENGVAPPNRPKALADLTNLVEQLDMFVAEEDNTLVGLLGIEDSELRYSDHHVLVDAYFFVLPEYRGGRVGIQLMQAATLEAERLELPLLIRVNNPERAKQRGRIGEIVGYTPVGYTVRLR